MATPDHAVTTGPAEMELKGKAAFKLANVPVGTIVFDGNSCEITRESTNSVVLSRRPTVFNRSTYRLFNTGEAGGMSYSNVPFFVRLSEIRHPSKIPASIVGDRNFRIRLFSEWNYEADPGAIGYTLVKSSSVSSGEIISRYNWVAAQQPLNEADHGEEWTNAAEINPPIDWGVASIGNPLGEGDYITLLERCAAKSQSTWWYGTATGHSFLKRYHFKVERLSDTAAALYVSPCTLHLQLPVTTSEQIYFESVQGCTHIINSDYELWYQAPRPYLPVPNPFRFYVNPRAWLLADGYTGSELKLSVETTHKEGFDTQLEDESHIETTWSYVGTVHDLSRVGVSIEYSLLDYRTAFVSHGAEVDYKDVLLGRTCGSAIDIVDSVPNGPFYMCESFPPEMKEFHLRIKCTGENFEHLSDSELKFFIKKFNVQIQFAVCLLSCPQFVPPLPIRAG